LVSVFEALSSPSISWIDWIDPIASVVSALAAIAAAGFAVYGVNTWRFEAVGRQRAEVATRTLSSFYKLRDVFSSVRSPMVWAEEMVPEPDENAEFGAASETAPIRRMRSHRDFLADFQSQKYLFGAVFGSEHFSLFDGVARLHNEVVAASQILFQNRGSEEARKSFHPIAFEARSDDKITTTLEDLIKRAEAICEPAIRASVKR
jgi:hypothetical protein